MVDHLAGAVSEPSLSPCRTERLFGALLHQFLTSSPDFAPWTALQCKFDRYQLGFERRQRRGAIALAGLFVSCSSSDAN
jgi:hypothetical protein